MVNLQNVGKNLFGGKDENATCWVLKDEDHFINKFSGVSFPGPHELRRTIEVLSIVEAGRRLVVQGWAQAWLGLSAGADRNQRARSLGIRVCLPGRGFLGPLWTWTDDPLLQGREGPLSARRELTWRWGSQSNHVLWHRRWAILTKKHSLTISVFFFFLHVLTCMIMYKDMSLGLFFRWWKW